jgi:hypothetical protein
MLKISRKTAATLLPLLMISSLLYADQNDPSITTIEIIPYWILKDGHWKAELQQNFFEKSI